MADKSTEGGKCGAGKSNLSKSRKKADEPMDGLEVRPTTIGGIGLAVGATLGEASDKSRCTGHKYAGLGCQAPKGEGICGAAISALNPYVDIPICQPCAERLRKEAWRRGEVPDIKKIWKRILAGRRTAARCAGIQKPKPDSSRRSETAGADTVAKSSAS